MSCPLVCRSPCRWYYVGLFHTECKAVNLILFNILLSVENHLKMLSYISVSWIIISFDNDWQPPWYQAIIATKFQTDKITCSYYDFCIESEPKVFWTSVLTKHPLSPFLLKWSCPYPVEWRKSCRFHGGLTHMINTFHDFIHKHIFPIMPCCISGCLMLQVLTSGWGFLEQNHRSSAQRRFKPCPRYNFEVLWWEKITAFIYTWWGYSYNSQIKIMWVIVCILCTDLVIMAV